MIKSVPSIIKDYLNPHHLEKFYTLLANRIDVPSYSHTLNLGDHLLYFNPIKNELNADGYFDYQTPSALLGDPDLQFRRRLWVQGEINAYRELNLGQEYTCQERVRFVKRIRSDYFVCIERNVSDHRGIVTTTELRTLIYTNSLAEEKPPATATSIEGLPIGAFTFKEMDIIRYGNLSLNPHRIHWDKTYCKEKEGYENIIVQGPFLVQVLVKIAHGFLRKPFKKLKYKNTNHIYPNTEVQVCLLEPCGDTNTHQLKMSDKKSGKVFLEANLTT